ncbi:PREDICTED: protein PET117 homolog, mitochondrial [Colobus angolensis palliatus]|uniref:protein PET117 homolog, mitochondrial n=1 Tax=Colobus angolensis palliatus TaxID=336983 RepID=UPI0005F449D2|nr:PREDICTED: protein PET117 homolog, mitochondrial [Colobus angolensis palliatus]
MDGNPAPLKLPNEAVSWWHLPRQRSNEGLRLDEAGIEQSFWINQALRRDVCGRGVRRYSDPARGEVVLGLSVLLTAATVAGVHVKQQWDQQRLRDGVIRDIERQIRKKENIRLLGEQIILTEQLEAEREKMLLAKGSQKS